MPFDRRDQIHQAQLVVSSVQLLLRGCAVNVRLCGALGGSIRESVDSLCRDGVDMPMPPYIRKACNRLNAAIF